MSVSIRLSSEAILFFQRRIPQSSSWRRGSSISLTRSFQSIHRLKLNFYFQFVASCFIVPGVLKFRDSLVQFLRRISDFLRALERGLAGTRTHWIAVGTQGI